MNKEQEKVPQQEKEEVGSQLDQKETISYDDFEKLDIALGTILSVEVVEGANKLLRLMVDTGAKESDGTIVPRQIVSGIREYFDDVQSLVGKQCPFLINLESRTIRGYESQGMILAAEHDGVLAMLIPHTDLPPGTRVV